MAVKFVGNRETEDSSNRLFLIELDKDDIDTVTDALLGYGRNDLAGEFAHILKPDSVPELLHQGDLISGSEEDGNRRWIAAVLHEQEIRDACESTGTDFCTLNLDSVVKRYTDALLGDGGWYESLKTIVAEEGAEEAEDADTDADADFGEYTAGNRPCPNCGSDRETEYVPVCDRNPGGLASQTPEEHGNIQPDGTVLCEDGYCNPREITMKEFRAINGKDAEPQDVITRCHGCGTIKG
ncbi:MAG TPA: hypothetical protein VF172_11935 [Nitrososphaera sp.]|jgi:hypothetical protein